MKMSIISSEVMQFLTFVISNLKQKMRAQDPKFSNNTLFWVKLEIFIDPNHKLVELRKQLPWEQLVEIWDRAYSNEDFWNEKIHPRIMVAILIYHAYYLKKSFRELKEDFRYNIVLQYFCGYEELQLMKIDHSTINKFESALWEENIKEILKIVEDIAVKKQPPRSKWTSVSDTTVIPSNISFPTDINLLEKIRVFLHDFLLENQKIIWEEYRTYAKTARENYISYSKARKISKKDIKKKLKKQIQFVRRNISQSEDLIWKIEDFLKDKKLSFTKKELKQFEKLKKKIGLAKEILQQQEILYRDWKLPKWTWRMVSFYRKNIRPIYRWKKLNRTEFWLKVDFIKIWKAIILWKNSYDNFHDWSALKESIEQFENRWIKDKVRIWDKWLSGQSKLMKEKWIIDWIEKRWKRTTPKKVSKKIFKRERALIEATIWIFKNVFYWNTKSRAKTDFGDKRNVLLWFIGYNLRYAF